MQEDNGLPQQNNDKGNINAAQWDIPSMQKEEIVHPAIFSSFMKCPIELWAYVILS